MPAGEIPPEIKKQLVKSGVIKESLPSLKMPTESTQPPETTASDLPPILTGEPLQALVNENEEKLAPVVPPPTDVESAERYKELLAKQRAEIKELKDGSKNLQDSKKFRIYLALLEGFAAKGLFDADSLTANTSGTGPTKLAPQQAQARLEQRLQHASNIVAYAYAAIEKLPEKHRF